MIDGFIKAAAGVPKCTVADTAANTLEIKRLIGQLLNLIGDFDVLVALDLFAVHHEANRHRVPEFRCELSAFHVFYLRGIFLPRG